MAALQCFESTARHLSFTRAAEELHLTQSAVSKQVAQLEDMLQHLLFHRVRRRLELTPAGMLYLTEVDKILTQVDMSSRYILSYGGETEVLRVATQPTFGARWLIPNLNGFGSANPNIHLDIRNELEPFDLLKGKADVIFFYGQPNWPGAICHELFGESVVPVCSPDMLGGRELADPTAFERHTLLQCASRPEAWHDWFRAQGYATERSYHGPRFDTFYMCIHAAQAGCGIALVPRFLVEAELAEGKLAVASSFALNSHGAHYMAYGEHATDIPKVRALVDWISGKAIAARLQVADAIPPANERRAHG
jgi:DNA-binding transcriptional LysR family regulator